MGSSNQARSPGRAAFLFCFNLIFVPADRESCLKIYLYYVIYTSVTGESFSTDGFWHSIIGKLYIII